MDRMDRMDVMDVMDVMDWISCRMGEDKCFNLPIFLQKIGKSKSSSCFILLHPAAILYIL